MARQAVEAKDELSILWNLVGELSEQLANNKATIERLSARSENVKGQAAHVGTGFPLRRFNLDITNEEFQSELEKFAAHLVLETQQLQNENKQLNGLLKEYESTLETVMGKFRGVAHASQQHDLQLHSYYSTLLETLQNAHSSARLHDDTSLSLLLTRLSTLLRSALRSMGGETPDQDLASLLPNLTLNGLPDGTESGPSRPISPTKSNSSGKKSASSGERKLLQRPPSRPASFMGYQPGATGGYWGTEGQSDWAMEREIEIQRLEEENRTLRELLAVSGEPAVVEAVEEEIQEETKELEPEELPRKSSLTAEELANGAEQEEEWEKAVRQNGFDPDALRNQHGDGSVTPIDPGTGLGGGGGVREGQQRPDLSESALGFTAEMPPPENAIDDGIDGSD